MDGFVRLSAYTLLRGSKIVEFNEKKDLRLSFLYHKMLLPN